MVQLSIEELKTVLTLLKKKKRRQKKNKKRKNKKQSEGYAMGGLKSDSSHLAQGYSQTLPFSNTSNQQTELIALQRNLLEEQIKNPDRFNRTQMPNNLLTLENFQKSMNMFGSQLGGFYDNRISLLEDKANQLSSDLGYSTSDLIRNKGNTAYIEQLPDDDGEEKIVQPYNFKKTDGVDVAQTLGSDNFKTQGNPSPYAEDDVIQREFTLNKDMYTVNPLHDKSKPSTDTTYFENTDIYPSKEETYIKDEPVKEPVKESTESKAPSGIMKKLTKMFKPSESVYLSEEDYIPSPKPSKAKEENVPSPKPKPAISLQKPIDTTDTTPIDISQMLYLETDWYKKNVDRVIPIELTSGFPKGEPGEFRLRTLLNNLGASQSKIDNYFSRAKRYADRKDLYTAIYAKVKANNNKLIKREEKLLSQSA